MNQTLKIILITLAIVIIGVGLVAGGFFWGHNGFFNSTNFYGGMMNGTIQGNSGSDSYGPGNMMGQVGTSNGYMSGGMMVGGMMGNYSDSQFSNMPMNGTSMMNSSFWNSDVNVDPLTVEAAEEAIQSYISEIGDVNLEIKDIMIFSNHAYAQIVEIDTGIGAMEVLVDPVSGYVSLEFGPSMMWNTKYGMHSGFGSGMMGGGMMGGENYSWSSDIIEQPMQVSEDEAVELAQEYLDANLPGLEADEHADEFYGYYTLHTLENGEVTGMLSVNGYTGDIFIHTWHGDIIEMDSDH